MVKDSGTLVTNKGMILMEINNFLAGLNRGESVEGGSELHKMMYKLSQEALKTTIELNGHYHTSEEVLELFSL